MVDLLLKNGAKVNAKDKNFNTALHWVAMIDDADQQYAIAELLLKNGAAADANAKNHYGKTPTDLIENSKGKVTNNIIKEGMKLKFFELIPKLKS